VTVGATLVVTTSVVVVTTFVVVGGKRVVVGASGSPAGEAHPKKNSDPVSRVAMNRFMALSPFAFILVPEKKAD
tara:strand:+ start:444 stop:665 length:222 start_codon:yes stop_codon:yes gene_type:complete